MTRVSTIVMFLIVGSAHAMADVCLWDVTSGGSATITGNNVRIDAAGTYKFEGSPGSGDIKVADMEFDLTHKYADSGTSSVTGSFYVAD